MAFRAVEIQSMLNDSEARCLVEKNQEVCYEVLKFSSELNALFLVSVKRLLYICQYFIQQVKLST